MARHRTKHALKIIDHMIGDDGKLRRGVQAATIHSQGASVNHEAGTSAGLSQKALADKVGTKQPVISQLENVDDEGHSLSMLIRVAEALEHGLEIQPVLRRGSPGKTSRGNGVRRVRAAAARSLWP